MNEPVATSLGERGSHLGNGMYKESKTIIFTFEMNCSQLVNMVSEPEE